MRNNFYIKSPFVQLLDENRQPLGQMPSGKARELANSRDIDLVLVNDRVNPPIYALGNGPADEITSATVRLMDSERNQLGIMSADEARKMATDRGEDIIILNGKCDPNICMLGDRKKYEYAKKKAAKENEKKQRAMAKASELKELKFPADTSDSSKGDRSRLYEKAREFIAEGHPVKITVRFRGRMMAHASEVMDRLYEEAATELSTAQLARPVATGNVFTIMCNGTRKK